MKPHFWPIFIILTSLLAQCTNQHPGDLPPYFPEKAQVHLDRFNYGKSRDVPIDTLQRFLDSFLEESCDTDWYDYYHSQLLGKQGYKDSAITSLLHLKERIDSSRNRYQWMCVKKDLSVYQNNRYDSYRDLNECFNFFSSINDSSMLFSCCNELGNLFESVHDFKNAERYMLKAYDYARDPLLKGVAQLNLSCLYDGMGDSLRADSLMRYICLNTSLYNNEIREKNYRNLYFLTLQPQPLYEGYRIVSTDPNLQSIKPVYQSLIASYYIINGDTLSAQSYLEEAIARAQNMSRPVDRLWLYEGYIALMEYKGNYKEANKYLHMAMATLDTVTTLSHDIQLSHLEAKNNIEFAIEKERMRGQSEKLHSMIVWIIVAVVLVFTIMLLLWRLRTHKWKARLREQQAAFEVTKSRKQVAATLLDLEEKERFLKSLSMQLGENNSQKDTFTLAQLEKLIDRHVNEADQRENFIEMFEKINPNFFNNLRNQYPSLKESQIKLAAYILSGMTNVQIAKMLMVKVESVHQARWMLRRSLGVPKEISLEEALHRLS